MERKKIATKRQKETVSERLIETEREEKQRERERKTDRERERERERERQTDMRKDS